MRSRRYTTESAKHKQHSTHLSAPETLESPASAAVNPSDLDRLAVALTADIIEASEAQAIYGLMNEMLTRSESSAIAGGLVERWTIAWD